MDITSFILGRKSGRDSVKTQEKTVTPSEEEIVVTPDTGFDALSKVIVEAVEASGGGSGVQCTCFSFFGNSKTSITITRNFGFTPDLIVVLPGTGKTITSGLVCGFAVSTRMEALMTGLTGGTVLLQSSKLTNFTAIDATIDNPIEENYSFIHGATSNGFTISETTRDGEMYYALVLGLG